MLSTRKEDYLVGHITILTSTTIITGVRVVLWLLYQSLYTKSTLLVRILEKDIRIFENVGHDVSETEQPEFAVYISNPDKVVTRRLLPFCEKLRQNQRVSCVINKELKLDTITDPDVLAFARTAQILILHNCSIPQHIAQNLFEQRYSSLTTFKPERV